MKNIFALSAFVLMLASLVGCSSMRPLPIDYNYGPGGREETVVNPNAYAKSQTDAVDRVCNLTRQQYRKVFKAYWREIQDFNRHIESNPDDTRLDRSYIREHGRLERKMKKILDADQFARWRRIDGRNRRF